MRKLLLSLFIVLCLATTCFGAWESDGENDYINLSAANTSLQGSTGFTLYISFRNVADDTGWVASRWDTGSTSWQSWRISVNDESVTCCVYSSGSKCVGTTGIDPSDGKLINLVCHYDGDDLYLYKNGTADGSVAAADNLSGDQNLAGRLCTDNDGNNDQKAIIYEVAFWDVNSTMTAADHLALTTGQVRYLPMQFPTGLIRYYKLDSGEPGTAANGESVYDYTGTYDTTATNGTWADNNAISHP